MARRVLIAGVAFCSFLLALAFVPMLIEMARSVSNERALRAAGAVEPPDDVYPMMQVVYPACFAAMTAEAWLRGSGVTTVFVAGVIVFIFSKALKYWAIATLGPRWTFRVLVPPRSGLVTSGPYRFLRHPNYVGVAGELAGFAVLAQAPIAGAVGFVAFGWLMLARIKVEEAALGTRSG